MARKPKQVSVFDIVLCFVFGIVFIAWDLWANADYKYLETHGVQTTALVYDISQSFYTSQLILEFTLPNGKRQRAQIGWTPARVGQEIRIFYDLADPSHVSAVGASTHNLLIPSALFALVGLYGIYLQRNKILL